MCASLPGPEKSGEIEKRKGQTDLEPSVYQYTRFGRQLDIDIAFSPLAPVPCGVCPA